MDLISLYHESKKEHFKSASILEAVKKNICNKVEESVKKLYSNYNFHGAYKYNFFNCKAYFYDDKVGIRTIFYADVSNKMSSVKKKALLDMMKEEERAEQYHYRKFDPPIRVSRSWRMSVEEALEGNFKLLPRHRK